MAETSVSNPILIVDLTDDDPESGGVEIWPEDSSQNVQQTVKSGFSNVKTFGNVMMTPVAGPSTSYQSPNDFEWESEDYMKFLQKLQDDFNKEFNEEEVEPDASQNVPFMELPSNSVGFPSTSNRNSTKSMTVAGSSKTSADLNNNPSSSKVNVEIEKVQMIETAPACHKYFNVLFTPTKKTFLAAVNKDRKMLQEDLPPGIFVKMFEDRLDLISALIEGPPDTPYEGCLFILDIQLSSEHPNKPPKVHYWSFCHQKLNPNLYSTGMICLSLLGTWHGASVERWTVKSTIFQLLISIQGLILVPEPYYNEPAYHQAKNTNKFAAASKQYNTKTLALVLESMTRQIEKPPEIFKEHILTHYRNTGLQTHQRLESYLPKAGHAAKKARVEPPFPLETQPSSTPAVKTLNMFVVAMPNLTQIETNLSSFYAALTKLKC